jgi:hypothetical protein
VASTAIVVLDSYADEIAELPLGVEFLQLVNGLTILAAAAGGLQFLTRAENLAKIKGGWAKVKNLVKAGTRAEIEAGFIRQLELAEQVAERAKALRTTEELTEYRIWLKQLEDEGKLTAELRGQAEVAAARYVEEVRTLFREENKGYLIENKFPDDPLPSDGVKYHYQLVNGMMHSPNGGIMDGAWNYIIDEYGELKIGYRHIFLANKKPVLAAGTVVVEEGKITMINNASGHYRPTPAEAENFVKAFQQTGFNMKDAELTIYEFTVDSKNYVTGQKEVKTIIFD